MGFVNNNTSLQDCEKNHHCLQLQLALISQDLAKAARLGM